MCVKPINLSNASNTAKAAIGQLKEATLKSMDHPLIEYYRKLKGVFKHLTRSLKWGGGGVEEGHIKGIAKAAKDKEPTGLKRKPGWTYISMLEN